MTRTSPVLAQRGLGSHSTSRGVLHAAMQIDANRAVRHPGTRRNFRTSHALDKRRIKVSR